MAWLQITSPRWTHELQRWLDPGDVVEVADDQVPSYAAHSTALPASPGIDVSVKASVLLRATRNLAMHGGRVARGQEFTVSGARAREIPSCAVVVIAEEAPGGLPPTVTRPAPVTSQVERQVRRRR